MAAGIDAAAAVDAIEGAMGAFERGGVWDLTPAGGALLVLAGWLLGLESRAAALVLKGFLDWLGVPSVDDEGRTYVVRLDLGKYLERPKSGNGSGG